MATPIGPVGSATFNFHGKYRLKVGSDITVPIAIVDVADGVTAIDLSAYEGGLGSFEGAGRREVNEALTTAPLFKVTVVETNLTGGLLSLVISGSELGQDTPARGYWSVYGIVAAGGEDLLIQGRFECEGGTVDPLLPVSA